VLGINSLRALLNSSLQPFSVTEKFGTRRQHCRWHYVKIFACWRRKDGTWADIGHCGRRSKSMCRVRRLGHWKTLWSLQVPVMVSV